MVASSSVSFFREAMFIAVADCISRRTDSDNTFDWWVTR